MPATFPSIIIFPRSWVTNPRFCFNIIPIHIFGSRTVSPCITTSNTACMTSDTLIQVHYHPKLCFNLQANRPRLCAFFESLLVHHVDFPLVHNNENHSLAVRTLQSFLLVLH